MTQYGVTSGSPTRRLQRPKRQYRSSSECTPCRAGPHYVYEYYKTVVSDAGNPLGTYCRWVRECLAVMGAPPEYFASGWPEHVKLDDIVDRWQHRAWRASAA